MAAPLQTRSPMRLLRRYWLVVAIVVTVSVFWLCLWTLKPTRVALITAIILPELFIDAPITPLKLITDAPIKDEVIVDLPDGSSVVADVYRPSGSARHGAFIFAVGAADKIRDHSAVIRLSNVIARTGTVVMVPQLYYPFDERARPEEVEDLLGAFGRDTREVVASFRWLHDQSYVDPNRVGIFGVSAGGGIALMAAADERIRTDVDFVAVLGSYFNIVDVISAVVSESMSYGGESTPWQPREDTARMVFSSLISYLPNSTDRDILTRVMVRRDEDARTDVPALSSAGRDIYEAYLAKDADRLFAIWSDVSPLGMGALYEISPSSYASNLHTELFIMTDRGDPYVPYVESRKLLDSAAGNGNAVHYSEFDFLSHVEIRPSNPISFAGDITRLLFIGWQIMLRLQ